MSMSISRRCRRRWEGMRRCWGREGCSRHESEAHHHQSPVMSVHQIWRLPSTSGSREEAKNIFWILSSHGLGFNIWIKMDRSLYFIFSKFSNLSDDCDWKWYFVHNCVTSLYSRGEISSQNESCYKDFSICNLSNNINEIGVSHIT